MRKSEQGWRDEEDGEVREFMGVREKSCWRIQSRLKNAEEWIRHEPPKRRYVEKLIELLELKYRRQKGSLKEVEVARRLLDQARG